MYRSEKNVEVQHLSETSKKIRNITKWIGRSEIFWSKWKDRSKSFGRCERVDLKLQVEVNESKWNFKKGKWCRSERIDHILSIEVNISKVDSSREWMTRRWTWLDVNESKVVFTRSEWVDWILMFYYTESYLNREKTDNFWTLVHFQSTSAPEVLSDRFKSWIFS